MSYCRFSCMDFTCDLYCYESVDGYETLVASTRHLGAAPEITEPIVGGDATLWLAQHKAQSDFLASAQREDIGGPHDKAHFTDRTPLEFLDRLSMLRAAGYRFPDHVLDTVREEIADYEAVSGSDR